MKNILYLICLIQIANTGLYAQESDKWSGIMETLFQGNNKNLKKDLKKDWGVKSLNEFGKLAILQDSIILGNVRWVYPDTLAKYIPDVVNYDLPANLMIKFHSEKAGLIALCTSFNDLYFVSLLRNNFSEEPFYSALMLGGKTYVFDSIGNYIGNCYFSTN